MATFFPFSYFHLAAFILFQWSLSVYILASSRGDREEEEEEEEKEEEEGDEELELENQYKLSSNNLVAPYLSL